MMFPTDNLFCLIGQTYLGNFRDYFDIRTPASGESHLQQQLKEKGLKSRNFIHFTWFNKAAIGSAADAVMVSLFLGRL